MPTPSNRPPLLARRVPALLRRAGLASWLLLGASGCLFGGGAEEDEIDPQEATEREAEYRSDAEIARDQRFRDRLKRRTDLSAPLREPDNDSAGDSAGDSASSPNR